MKPVALLAISLIALPVPTAAGGEVADKAAKAEQAAAGGDVEAAIAAFDAAEEALWKALPLTVRNVTQVTSATGVGVYAPRDNHIYKKGETVTLYVEPVGYAFGKDELGYTKVDLSADIAFKSAEGKAVFGEENMPLKIPASRSRNRSLYIKLNVKLGDEKPGKYIAEMKLHDRTSNKSAVFSTDVEIAP